MCPPFRANPHRLLSREGIGQGTTVPKGIVECVLRTVSQLGETKSLPRAKSSVRPFILSFISVFQQHSSTLIHAPACHHE